MNEIEFDPETTPFTNPIAIYVLYDESLKAWCSPFFTGLPFVSTCLGFKLSPPFLTNPDAYNLLIMQNPPGIENVKLRVARIELINN